MTNMNGTSFIALSVGQGDAFFLSRAGYSILIDGGRSLKKFTPQFHKTTGQASVDILVCTHNDSDHANGILGFMRDDGTSFKEIWLPGRWTSRLNDLLVDPEIFVKELINNIADLKEVKTLEQIADSDVPQKDSSEAAPKKVDSLSSAFERATKTHFSFPHYPRHPHYMCNRDLHLFDGNLSKWRLFLDAISNGNRIREISLAAYSRGAKIRWFGPDAVAGTGGIRAVLIPVNMGEVYAVQRPKLSALSYIALTLLNRESLVFFSPPQNDVPAVLFSADSDFSFSQSIPWSDGMIITAPHHGSEANKQVYDKFVEQTEGKLQVNWVRSDGRFKKRPGNSYLDMRKYGSLFCTLCRGGQHPKKDVHLIAKSGSWHSVNNTQACCCK